MTWWHLEALAARLQELLPAQLELALETSNEAAERAVDGVEAPTGPLAPPTSLGAAPRSSQTEEDPQRAQCRRAREPQTDRRTQEERPQGDWSEFDIALWPLLYGPGGIFGRRRRGRPF